VEHRKELLFLHAKFSLIWVELCVMINSMQIPSPLQIKKELPIGSLEQLFISEVREQIKNLISQKDNRLAIVMGPCSIHDFSSALEYADRFKKLSLEVEESCLLIMRVYIEKPRTKVGWKGFLYDPHLDGSNDIYSGIYETRKLLLELARKEIAVATELLDPLAHLYFNDLLSWGFIGARTSESQPHRQLASSLSIPIGFKNATDGNIESAINGVLSATSPHSFLSINEMGVIVSQTSSGNPFSHIVLRGSTESPNYDEDSIRRALIKLEANNLAQCVMIDCAHGNCGKQYLRQKEVFIYLINKRVQEQLPVFGLMLESHLKEGNLSSLTDPCIDWATTEKLVKYAHSQLCSFISSC